MGSRRILKLTLTLVVAATVLSTAAAQSDCSNVLVSLSPCLDYITGNSSTPSSGCCNQLANVIKAQAVCLCEIINGSVPSIGVKINQTRAFELPGSCNLQTPSISQCNVTAAPPSGTPPSGSTGGSPPGTPRAPGGNGSGGYRINMSFTDDGLFSILLILMASIFVSISTAII